MSFSPIYHYLLQKRKVTHRHLFFERLTMHLQRLRMKDRYVWMYDYVHALDRHCPEIDISYCVSTRSVDHFVKSLNRLLSYEDVDDLCLDICFRHVCHLCVCRNGETTCLQPHEKWVYIPMNASSNHTWIPIPYNVMQDTNVSELREFFKLIYMHDNDLLSNHTIYPKRGKVSPSISIAMIIYLCFLFILSVGGITLLIVAFMQKRLNTPHHLIQHGQTTYHA